MGGQANQFPASDAGLQDVRGEVTLKHVRELSLGAVLGAVLHLVAVQFFLLTVRPESPTRLAVLLGTLGTVVLVVGAVWIGSRHPEVAVVAATTMAVLVVVSLLVGDGRPPTGIFLSPLDLVRHGADATLTSAVAAAAAASATLVRSRDRNRDGMSRR